jgi:hypothetical protein
MILDQSFSRVVVISLPGAEARAERALRELRDKRLSEKAVVVRAINGKIVPPSDWWAAGGGAWGCMRSHHRVVEDALMDGLESLLVIEDDCIWQTDAATMAAEFLKAVPKDWGQIYFGGQHRSQYPPIPTSAGAAVWKVRSVHRTHAYAIHKRAMAAFLKHILYAPDYIEAKQQHGYSAHVDHQLETAHRRGDWVTYAPSWWLAGQGENKSSINGRQQKEQWWHRVTGESYRRAPLVICDRKPTEEELRHLHFGRHLDKNDPSVDVGIKGCVDAAALMRVMTQVANEAVAAQSLPAMRDFEDRPEMAEWLRTRWLGPVWKLSEGRDLAASRDFPQSKLIYHDWFNPRGAKAPAAPASEEPEAESSAPVTVSKVHQVWIGPNDMPPRLAAYCETLRKALPGWEYKLWRDEDMPGLAVNAVLPEVVLGTAIVPLGVRVDTIRLEIIRQHGGIYFDSDFEALRSDLRLLFERSGVFYYADERVAFPLNSLLGSHEPYHPLVDLYLEHIANKIGEGVEINVHWACGPHAFNQILNEWTSDWAERKWIEIAGEKVAPIYGNGSLVAFYHHIACPYAWGKGTWATFKPEDHPRAWLAHHWAQTWHES